MTEQRFIVGVITRSALDRPDDGRDLFRIIEDSASVFIPGRAGVDEPPRRRFSWEALERDWGDMLYVWTGRDVPGVEGLVFRDLRPPPTQMPSISVNAPVDVLDPRHRLDLRGLLRALSLRFDAWFGYAHVMTVDERATFPAGDPGALPGDPPDLIITEEQVRRALPPLTWATVFGSELLERIGVEAFAGAPAAVAEVWEDRIGYLQLTGDPLDTLDEVRSARRATQEHLGRRLFEEPAEAAGDALPPPVRAQPDGMLARAFALAADMAGAGEAPAEFGCFLREDGGIEFVSASEDMPASDREEAVMHLLRAAAATPDVVCAGVVVLTREEARVTLEHRKGERMRVIRPYRLRSGAVEWSEPCTSDADMRFFSQP